MYRKITLIALVVLVICSAAPAALQIQINGAAMGSATITNGIGNSTWQNNKAESKATQSAVTAWPTAGASRQTSEASVKNTSYSNSLWGSVQMWFLGGAGTAQATWW